MFSVVLGRDVESGQEVRLGDVERRSGLYILGKPGMGKSALMVNMQLQDIDHGHGLFFLDPHGDAIVDLLRRTRGNSILLDPEDDEYSFGINLLACPNVSSLRVRTETYTKAYNVFYKLWEEQWGVWLQLILQNILWAFIENQDYTLADVPMFLNPRNEDFRNHIIGNIQYNSPVADFWRYEFFSRREQDQQERVDAALTRINTLLTHPYVRHIIGQQKTTIDFENVLSKQKIILVRLSANLAEDIKKFIGTILISELLHAIRARPEAKRTQFCIFVDEFQNFSSADDFRQLLTEGRKFGVATTIAHQERFGQFADNERMMGATLAAANKVVFQATVKDAEELAPEFAKTVEPTEVRREAELVISPRPVEDIWERGHPSQTMMDIRTSYFWIVDLLKRSPQEQIFLFGPSRKVMIQGEEICEKLPWNHFDDWQYYSATIDMVRQGISLLNSYYYNWMTGVYSLGQQFTKEQINHIANIIQCLGGLYGIRPGLEPYISEPMRHAVRQALARYRSSYPLYQRHKRPESGSYNVIIGLNVQQALEAPHFPHSLLLLDSSDKALPHRIDELRWHPARPINEDNFYKRLRLFHLIMPIPGFFHLPKRYRDLHIMECIPDTFEDFTHLKALRELAIYIDMSTHEIENLISWRERPFDAVELEAYPILIKYMLDMAFQQTKQKQERFETIRTVQNLYAEVRTIQATKNNIASHDPLIHVAERANWQMSALMFFLLGVLGSARYQLIKNPVKVATGQYTETMGVERPQHDLVTDMILELSRLPRFEAYAKLIDESQGRQVVNTHRIQTYPLPSSSTDTHSQAIANGNKFAKKRIEIEEEIRERQSRWGRGGSPPPQTRRVR